MDICHKLGSSEAWVVFKIDFCMNDKHVPGDDIEIHAK